MLLKLSKGHNLINLNIFILINTVKLITSESMDERTDRVLLRERRQLLYPNSTLLQFNAGLTTHTPVSDRQLNVNWAFQANFQLPWNRTQIPTDVLLVGPGYTAQAREHTDFKNDRAKDDSKDNSHMRKASQDIHNEISQERTNEEFDSDFINTNQIKSRLERVTSEEILSEQNKLLDNKRIKRSKLEQDLNNDIDKLDENRYQDEVNLHHVYKYLEEFLSGFGHNGSNCVLRALCQLAAEPLHSDDEEDLLHELSQYLLDPSANHDVIPAEIQPYLEAQNKGRHPGDCEIQYPDCGLSLVDMFTRVHSN